jgi:hypothetical protein
MVLEVHTFAVLWFFSSIATFLGRISLCSGCVCVRFRVRMTIISVAWRSTGMCPELIRIGSLTGASYMATGRWIKVVIIKPIKLAGYYFSNHPTS